MLIKMDKKRVRSFSLSLKKRYGRWQWGCSETWIHTCAFFMLLKLNCFKNMRGPVLLVHVENMSIVGRREVSRKNSSINILYRSCVIVNRKSNLDRITARQAEKFMSRRKWYFVAKPNCIAFVEISESFFQLKKLMFSLGLLSRRLISCKILKNHRKCRQGTFFFSMDVGNTLILLETIISSMQNWYQEKTQWG